MRFFTCIFIVNNFVQRLRAFYGCATDVALAAFRVAFKIHLRKESRHVVILILRPALERMIVALVAVETGGQEQMRGVFHCFIRRAQHFVIRCRRMLTVGAVRRQDFLHELVVGRVQFHLLANPVAEDAGPFFAEELAVDLEQVGPFIGPMIHVIRTAD